MVCYFIGVDSEVQAVRRVVKRSTILIGTSESLFSWSSWLSVIARGCALMTMMASCNFAAIISSSNMFTKLSFFINQLISELCYRSQRFRLPACKKVQDKSLFSKESVFNSKSVRVMTKRQQQMSRFFFGPLARA